MSSKVCISLFLRGLESSLYGRAFEVDLKQCFSLMAIRSFKLFWQSWSILLKRHNRRDQNVCKYKWLKFQRKDLSEKFLEGPILKINSPENCHS